MLAAGGADADWRTFRAHLVSQEEAGAAGGGGSQEEAATPAAGDAGGWAHEIWAPEAGCLLIANPVKFRGSQSYFARAVVLLLEHDEHAGSIGILLNRPTPHTVGDVAPSLRLFAGCPLFSGGPVGDGLQFIHSLPDVHGSKEIMRGVFYGGDLHHAAYLIRQKGKTREGMAALASTFRFFFKYCSWGPQQLQKELSNTTVGAVFEPPSPVWWTCATSSEWLHAATKPHGLGRPPTLLRTQTSNVLWKAVLRQLGPAFAERIPPQEADDAPEVLRQHSQRSTSDYAAWRAVLAASRPVNRSPAPPTISPLEAAAVEIAKIEAQLDEEEKQRGLATAVPDGLGGSGQFEAALAEERDVGTAIAVRLDALAAEALQVLRTGMGRGADGGEEVARDPLAVVRAVNAVLFERHALGVAPDIADFPRNPRHFSLPWVLTRLEGDALMLALVYHSVAARLGLHLGCVCAGGQRLLQPGGDEERSSARSPSGRRCLTRNLWPLKRIHSTGTEGVLLEVALSPLEVPGRGSSLYIDVCDGGRLLNAASALEWRLAQTEGGLPLLCYEDESMAERGGEASPESLRAGLGVTTVEKLISRMLTGMMQGYVERDDPERVFRYSDSLAALDAACLSLLGRNSTILLS